MLKGTGKREVMNRKKRNIEKVQKALIELGDEGYKTFHSKLMPTIETEVIIGIRTPVLRNFAKEYAKTEESREFLKILPHKYYEENNLHGLLLMADKDYENCVAEVNKFLPYIDNWATCDMLSPKVFKKHLPELLEEIKIWMQSEHTYTMRFGISMLMKHFLDKDFKMEYPKMVAEVKSEEYYVNMMRAWYFATALAKQYELVLPFLEEGKLDTWTHNKAIQKAIESYRITPEQKVYLRTLKRK